MRLFVAISVPKKIIIELKRLQSGIPDAKLKKVSDFHLTLSFLGEIDKSNIDSIKEKLSSVSFSTFILSLTHTGTFPASGHPRVVWAGLNKSTELFALKDSISSVIKSEVPFSPHITLARVKFVDDSEKFKNAISNIQVNEYSFPVSSFYLMKSVLTPRGPVYSIVEEFKSLSSK